MTRTEIEALSDAVVDLAEMNEGGDPITGVEMFEAGDGSGRAMAMVWIGELEARVTLAAPEGAPAWARKFDRTILEIRSEDRWEDRWEDHWEEIDS